MNIEDVSRMELQQEARECLKRLITGNIFCLSTLRTNSIKTAEKNSPE